MPALTVESTGQSSGAMVRSSSESRLDTLSVRQNLGKTLVGCNACDFKKHEAHKFFLPGCRGLPRAVWGLPDPGVPKGRLRGTPSLGSPRSLGDRSALASGRELSSSQNQSALELPQNIHAPQFHRAPLELTDTQRVSGTQVAERVQEVSPGVSRSAQPGGAENQIQSVVSGEPVSSII